jgi:DNA-binding CsgD family transcriptional regulator
MSGQRTGNRERVYEMTKQGISPKMIAKKLNIALNTVYVHQHHLRLQGRLEGGNK